MIWQESTSAIRDAMLKTNFTLHTPTLSQVADCTTRIVLGHSCMVPSEQITPSKLTHSSTFILCHPKIKKSDSHQGLEKRSRKVVNPSTIPILLTDHLSHCTKHCQSMGNITDIAAAVYYLLVRGILLQLLKDPDK